MPATSRGAKRKVLRFAETPVGFPQRGHQLYAAPIRCDALCLVAGRLKCMTVAHPDPGLIWIFAEHVAIEPERGFVFADRARMAALRLIRLAWRGSTARHASTCSSAALDLFWRCKTSARLCRVARRNSVRGRGSAVTAPRRRRSGAVAQQPRRAFASRRRRMAYRADVHAAASPLRPAGSHTTQRQPRATAGPASRPDGARRTRHQRSRGHRCRCTDHRAPATRYPYPC